MDAARYTIRPLGEGDADAWLEHFSRHRAESGTVDYHFMPFEPGDPDGPMGIDTEKFEEIGIVRDLVRLGGDSIDNVQMTLNVGSAQ